MLAASYKHALIFYTWEVFCIACLPKRRKIIIQKKEQKKKTSFTYSLLLQFYLLKRIWIELDIRIIDSSIIIQMHTRFAGIPEILQKHVPEVMFLTCCLQINGCKR